jgi:hypothetical protein
MKATYSIVIKLGVVVGKSTAETLGYLYVSCVFGRRINMLYFVLLTVHLDICMQ